MFFEKVDTNTANSPKEFWAFCKPFFTNKCCSNEIVSLLENDAIVQEDSNVADIFNNYFNTITSALNNVQWKPDYVCKDLCDLISKFSDHPSILKIRHSISDGSTFHFSHIQPWDTYQVIMGLNPSKSTSGSLPTKILQCVAKECSVPLTDCFNNCIFDGVFPTELKLASIIPVLKSGVAAKATTDLQISYLHCQKSLKSCCLCKSMPSLRRNSQVCYVVSGLIIVSNKPFLNSCSNGNLVLKTLAKLVRYLWISLKLLILCHMIFS